MRALLVPARRPPDWGRTAHQRGRHRSFAPDRVFLHPRERAQGIRPQGRFGEMRRVNGVRAGAFAVRDRRELLLAAMAELVAEQGYERTTIGQVLARAGVEERAFGLYFDSKEDCLLAAYDAAAEQAFSTAAEAFMATPGSWAEAIHSALAALLDYSARTPTFARLAHEALMHGGERAVAGRDRALDLFMEFLEPGYAIAGESPDAPRTPSHMIAGAVYELLHRHVVEDCLEELPDALPEITLIVLSPFVGRGEATRIAAGGVRRG